jgi:UPF0271 protein
LLSRNITGAVHNREKMIAQVKLLKEQSSVITINGKRLPLEVDSLCVHGDNLEGVEAIATIRELIR